MIYKLTFFIPSEANVYKKYLYMLQKKGWLISFQQVRDFTDEVMLELALSVGGRQKGISDKGSLDMKPQGTVRKLLILGKCLEGR